MTVLSLGTAEKVTELLPEASQSGEVPKSCSCRWSTRLPGCLPQGLPSDPLAMLLGSQDRQRAQQPAKECAAQSRVRLVLHPAGRDSPGWQQSLRSFSVKVQSEVPQLGLRSTAERLRLSGLTLGTLANNQSHRIEVRLFSTQASGIPSRSGSKSVASFILLVSSVRQATASHSCLNRSF